VAKARKRRAAAARGAAKAVGRGAATHAEEQGGGSQCFAQVVADRLAVSKRTAERALKRSRVFSDDDHETFKQCDVTATQQDAIATIVDPELRAQCLWDIIQGLDPDEAIARYKTRSGAAADITTEAERDEAKMADPDWLEGVCGEVRRRLKDPKVYDANALLYRKIEKLRRQFKAQVQEHLDRIEPGLGGPFARLVGQICHVTHPKDWRVCDACGGAGAGPDGSRCPKCFYPGSGYRLEFEKGR
jgi:hypothetical protein